MRYQTELMRQILTNAKAQEIIDWVSQLYGESYVGLWMFQSIGTELGDINALADQLRFETSPATTSLLIGYWEDCYNLPRNPNLTIEQRRQRIIAYLRQRGPCTPERMANAVSAALDGVPVDVTERVAKNTFHVNIREAVPSLLPAVAVVERMKPAHLIYTVQIVTQTVSETELKMAIALVQGETYKVEVQPL